MSDDFLIRDHKAKETAKHLQQYYKTAQRKPVWREYVEVIALALIAAAILRVFVVSAYRVSSSSMEDTLLTGDYIFVNKLAYKYREPQVSDIIVFEYPLSRDKDYIKRVIAVGGQTVEVIDKILYVDGELAELYPDSKNIDPNTLAAQLSNRDNYGPVQVPAGNLFVMGDNRDDSRDSRFWGFVPLENLKGKALFVYWSWTPDPSPTEWTFPYIHTALFELGSSIIGFPSRTRWDRIAHAL